jgi:hypothetical protein
VRIFFASGYTIMNVKNGENKLFNFGAKGRLINFHDIVNTNNKAERTLKIWGNHIMNYKHTPKVSNEAPMPDVRGNKNPRRRGEGK